MPVMFGESQAIEAVRTQLQRYAACDVQVLIEGEAGTGKELAVREIHYASTRRNLAFMPIAYLDGHPQATDTLQGTVNWWLPRQRHERDRQRIEQALCARQKDIR